MGSHCSSCSRRPDTEDTSTRGSRVRWTSVMAEDDVIITVG